MSRRQRYEAPRTHGARPHPNPLPQEREQLASDIVQFERSGLQRPKYARDEILIMNHPTPEQLVSWVYGESTPKEQRELRAHLNDCADCRAQVDTWRGTMNTLDEMPAPVAHRRSTSRPLQWAAAATLIVGFG